MLEGFPLASYPPLVGVLVLIMFPYLQMARGKLVPRSTLLDAIKTADDWREAHKVSEAARAAQTEQMRVLLASTEAIESTLRSIAEHRPT